MNEHMNNLKQAFTAINIKITDEDVPLILSGGADKFLASKRCLVCEEDLAGHLSDPS